MFKQHPARAMQMLGIDPVAFAEQTVRANVEDRMLTPEQREARENARMANAIIRLCTSCKLTA